MPKNGRIGIRVSKEKLHGWKTAAEAAGVTLSEWIEQRCDGGFETVAEMDEIVQACEWASEQAAKAIQNQAE